MSSLSLPDLSGVSFSPVPSYADLFVLSFKSGCSCLGFDVCSDWTARIARELGRDDLLPSEWGTIAAYGDYLIAYDVAQQAHGRGFRFKCMLSPQLIGLEGKRVEVVTTYGETRRFQVGRSTGWLPIHLEVARCNSSGGPAAEQSYRSVRVVG